MMERRRALSLQFTVDKNNLMENPIRIPVTSLSPDCGKLGQVSWTAFAGCKLRSRHSQHKNGSMVSDHSHTAMIRLEMKRRKPLLILSDVLKTEQGKAYIERIKMRQTTSNRGRLTSTQRESSQSKEEPVTLRERRSSQKETRISTRSKSVTCKSNQKTAPLSSQRSAVRKRLQNSDEDDKEDNQDIEEVIIGKDSGAEETFAEVVDCGLSLSWEPTEEVVGCHEFSPNSIKDRLADPEKDPPHRLKRRRKDSESQCNGTGSPKHHSEGILCHRDSVLRFTRENELGGEEAPAYMSQEESDEDMDLDNLDNCIVQFTVGGDDETEALVPVITGSLDSGDFLRTHRQSLSAGMDGTCQTSSEPKSAAGVDGPNKHLSTSGNQHRSERSQTPTTTTSSDWSQVSIVLSSDEEESGDAPQQRGRVLHEVLTVDKDSVLRRASSQEAVCKKQDSPGEHGAELLQVIAREAPCPLAPSPIPDMDMSLAFSMLHCGDYSGRANGSLMIAKHEIIIPLKDMSEQREVVLTFDRSELRKYSAWEQEELELRGLHFDGDESCPGGVLLLCVSETATAAAQRELRHLCAKGDGAINAGKASPIIFLTLRDPLVGMEGALLRSHLEIDCIKNLTLEQTASAFSADRSGSLLDINAPTLSMDESIELMKSSGLDSHLLFMLGLTYPDPELDEDHDSLLSEADEIPTAHIWLDAEMQKESEAPDELEVQAELEEPEESEEPDGLEEPEDLEEPDGLEEPEDLEEPEESVEPEEPEEREEPEELEAPPEEDKGTELVLKQTPEEEELQNPPDVLPQNKKEETKPVYTLCRRRTKGCYSVSLSKPDSRWIKYKHQGQARRLIQFPPPPLKGGITVTMEDLQCLDSGQYLNDVIIDFYLKYLLQNASPVVAERSHIFSSFFYKQLTRRDNASEGGNNSDSCQRQRRHQRVKTWTRHVDIFQKDFLFVPVNQEAHWYLVVICFPGLDEPKLESWTEESPGQSETRGCRNSTTTNDQGETSQTLNPSDGTNAEAENTQEEPTKDVPSGPVSCTEETCQRKTVCKRPCILIMDSLKLSLHERVFKLLREYLQSEWEVRRGSSREFGPDQMKSSHCKVPLQDNSSDCGLYLLQYVECFLKDPVVHFDLPLQLQQWFPRQQVRRKRDEIRDLVLNLYRRQNLDNHRAKSPSS